MAANTYEVHNTQDEVESTHDDVDSGSDGDSGDDAIDESEPVLVSEGLYDDVKPPAPVLPDAVPGYTDIGTTTNLRPPPAALYNEPNSDTKLPEFTSVPVISEETARQALLDYVSQQCCWGKGTAEKMKFIRLQSSTSYHYVLESFTESRSTEWVFEPFTGQPIHGPEMGRPPAPWEMEAKASALFEKEVRQLEVPFTSCVKECHVCGHRGFLICSRCKGRGKNRCGGCHGRGRRRRRRRTKDGYKTVHVRCTRCHGTGKRRCLRCAGTGRVTCHACKGHCSLRWYVQLTITWTNRKGQHIIERTDLPDELIATVQGNCIFQDTQPRVLPVSGFHDDEINRESQRLVGMHAKNFPNDLILMQRQTIRAVPVTQCYYENSGKNGQYFVYGLESRVHTPDYPDTCCWGCTIL